MTFAELGETLREFLLKKATLDEKYDADITRLNERFKGDFLTTQINERKATRDSELYALRSVPKHEIEAIRAEKIKLAGAAATTPPTPDMMTLLQALQMRKSVPKSELMVIAEAMKDNHHALNIFAEIALDNGYNIAIDTIEQVKGKINAACDLALNVLDGKTAIWVDDMISAYNEAEKRRDVMTMAHLNGRIHDVKNGGETLWDSTTCGLDKGITYSPTFMRVITPGETEIVKRWFDGVSGDSLKTAVNQKAADKAARELIELSDFGSLLDPNGAA